jgi:hypothetical protein
MAHPGEKAGDRKGLGGRRAAIPTGSKLTPRHGEGSRRENQTNPKPAETLAFRALGERSGRRRDQARLAS